MITVFASLLVVHGLIHVLGAAKAFSWVDLPQLTQPISPAYGTLWLLSALLFLATAALLFVWPRWWWIVGAIAVGLSIVVIVPSWADGKFGVLMNGVALVGVAFGFLSQGPISLRAEYDRDSRDLLSEVAAQPITDKDLAHLPGPVQRYLRAAGVVGQPPVHTYRVTMHGRIRDGRDGRWMPFAAEQHNSVDPPARLFYLNASMVGIPVQGYHRYIATAASMRVKAAALVPIVSATGEEMSRSETVTLFNDMCIMAPATLIDPAIEWEAVDARTVKGRFTNAGRTIQAVLFFNDAGELTDFVSDDRYQASSDGKTMHQRRWSTPIGGYREYGAVRLPSSGEGRWHEPDGPYAYIELTIDDVQYNVRPR
jgi:hypothetical protein